MSVRRKKSGGRWRWEAVVELGTDPVTNKRKQTTHLSDTKREAQAWERERQTGADSAGRVARERRTVGAILDQWLRTEARVRVKPTTYQGYEVTVRVHLTPAFGHIAVARLTAERVQEFYAGKLAAGVKPGVLRLCHLRLHQALEMARRHGYVTRNIMTDVKRIREPRMERPTWRPEEAARFLAAARQDHYWPIWRFLLETGVREGEALALAWTNVDFDACTVFIERTQTNLKGKLDYGPVKTDAPYTEHISPQLVAVLRDHRAAQLTYKMAHRDGWEEHGLVFTTRVGTPIPPTALWRNYNAIVKRAGIKRIRIHDLRHTSVTWAFDLGGHTKDVSRRVNHKSGGITLDRYAHGTPEQDVLLAGKLGAFIDGLSAHQGDDENDQKEADAGAG